jgi:hypothetical protein
LPLDGALCQAGRERPPCRTRSGRLAPFQASAKKAFADALANAGVDVKAATSVAGQELRRAFGGLLTRAQQAGAVRDDVDQAMAVLAGACLAAEHANWDRGLQAGALRIVFDGLRPAGSR